MNEKKIKEMKLTIARLRMIADSLESYYINGDHSEYIANHIDAYITNEGVNVLASLEDFVSPDGNIKRL